MNLWHVVIPQGLHLDHPDHNRCVVSVILNYTTSIKKLQRIEKEVGMDYQKSIQTSVEKIATNVKGHSLLLLRVRFGD